MPRRSNTSNGHLLITTAEPDEGERFRAHRACDICDHPQRAQIDEKIHRGLELGIIAMQHQLRKGLLTVHAMHGEADRLAQPEAIMARLDALEQRLLKVEGQMPEEPPIEASSGAMTMPEPASSGLEYAAEPGHDASLAGLHEPIAPCTCDWCQLSPYRRLRRAWDDVSRLEKERFCVETQAGEETW